MPTLKGKRVTDERLQRIKNLSLLESIALLDTSVTDDGVALLGKALKLRQIVIRSDLLTDACMVTLCRLPALTSLLIGSAPFITDRGVARLRERDSLRELYLKGTHLSDRGVRSFTHLMPIWSLALNRTLITDSGVSQLAPLHNLSLLSLDETSVVGYGLCDLPSPPSDVYLKGCPVTDDAVITLANKLTNLKVLSLEGTTITDKCLGDLAKLRKLEALRLTRTQVTDKGIAHFRAHPCLVELEVCETYVTEKEGLRLEEMSPINGMSVIRR